MKKTFATSILLLLSGLLLCADVVVEQTVITGEADYGTGAGQSFLLPAGQTVSAIELHIGSVGNGGGTIEVRLWRATGAPGAYFTRMDSQPIASGVLDRSDVSGQPNWFTITLDNSFTNSGRDPVYLVFEIELLTSGSSGWNNYSFSNLNSYSGGHRVYWSGSQYVINDGVDLTFRILDSPPASAIEIAQPSISYERVEGNPYVVGRIELRVDNTQPGYFYSLLVTEDLSIPIEFWDDWGGEEGNGGIVNWPIASGSLPDQQFFVIKATPIEK